LGKGFPKYKLRKCVYLGYPGGKGSKRLSFSGILYLCPSVITNMFKLIIILVLLIYLLNKVSVFIFGLGGRSQQPPPNFRRPPDGNIHMDSVPKKGNKKSGLKGGEYVDYEEIK
jgi:hypothetical protein